MAYRNRDYEKNMRGGNDYRDDRRNNRNNGGRGRGNDRRNGRYNDDVLNNEDRDNMKIYYDYARSDPNMVEIENITISKELVELYNKNIKNFDELNEPDGLKKSLLKGIYGYGFEEPSEIQKRTVPFIISGRDFLAQSQSGTGKTAAFVISLLQRIDDNLNAPQAIILSHTHELAAQTLTVVECLSEYMDLNISFTVGQVDRNNNILELNNGKNTCKVIIATPGRLLDLIEFNPKLFENIKLFIIDECDELLGSFKDTVRNIYVKLPSEMQTCLFSATLNASIVELSTRILNNPLKILIKKENMTLDGITQTEIKVTNEHQKFEVLLDLLSSINIEQFIIYVNSKEQLYYLNQRLSEKEYSSVCISSDNTKVERNEILKAFKKGEFKCLISTDVLARGIDIPQLFLVINYELPRKDNIESYIHRIGRSGRYGKKGMAINFNMTEFDQRVTSLIQMTFDCKIYPFTDEILYNYLSK